MATCSILGDARGTGLLLAIEIVADRTANPGSG
jgi:4-aminobutyrate aminotransferase-like enzyme